MAQLLINEFELNQMVAVYLDKRTPPRTAGYHVSDVISNLIKTVPSLAKTLNSDDETRNNMFSVGLVWETAVLEHIGWGEAPQVTVEGIICTADGLDPLIPRIDEMKATWKSLRNYNILDDFRYMTQAKAYCYAWKVKLVRFWVLHLNGNYAPPSPVGITYDLEFSEQEIQDNWFMLQNHMKLMISKGIEP